MKNIFIEMKRLMLLIAGIIFIVPACTNLDEELYSDLAAENFFTTEEENIAALGQAYSSMTHWGSHTNIWTTNELSSDELVIPTRGGDWYDGGILLQLHEHKFQPDNGIFNNAWNNSYGAINTVNRLIYQFSSIEGADAYEAELRAIRAFYYFHLMDMFGNVPLSVDFTDTETKPNSSRSEVFNFVKSELDAVIPLLSEKKDASTYGRINKWAALTLRMKLHLNAEEWTGTASWAGAKADADAVINSGLYSLEAVYSDNFKEQNEGSSENIFVVPYDEVFAGGFNWVAMTLHYASQNTFNLTFQPWNGYATVEEFYNSYIDPAQNPGPQGEVVKGKSAGTGTLDSRLSNFLVGDQGADDSAGGEAGDDDGTGLYFTPYINMIWPDACRQCGARINKYGHVQGGRENMNHDFVLLRYADVLLSKAEAHLRTGDASGALGIVNQIRTRAGVTPFSELTLDNLLAERGREMYVENDRRRALIRFGKWNDAWWAKEASDAKYKLFPIPKDQLNANPKLTQNPGY